MSRKWDARDAGREVARNTLKKLKTPPSFFLLFSTIHYEKYGGFQEFLNGVWDVLPKKTPLIGGTVTGFINGHGCFTRGATAFALSYVDMDVAIGYGKNTKRNPIKAGKNCAKVIRKSLETSKYKNKLLLNLVSGGQYPNFPFLGITRVIKGKVLPKLWDLLFHYSEIVIQKGVGRESEVLKGLRNELEDYYFIGGGSNDDNSYLNNYQFYNNLLMKNSVVALGISMDRNLTLRSGYGLNRTGKKLKITKKGWKSYIIKELDNLPATSKFLEAVGWHGDLLDTRINHRTPFFPFGAFDDEGVLFPYPVGIFLGDYLVFSHNIVSDEIELLDTSGKKLIGAVDNTVNNNDIINPLFGYSISCCARLETLGKNIIYTKNKMEEVFGDNFLVLYTMGENVGKPGGKIYQLQETFNLLSIG
jgi:hypothetical protein